MERVTRWQSGAAQGVTWLAVNGLAAYRITRLLQRDSLPPLPAVREKLLEKYGHLPVADLIDCPWCLGFWVSTGVVVAAASPWRRLWAPLAAALALSAVVGLLATHTHD